MEENRAICMDKEGLLREILIDRNVREDIWDIHQQLTELFLLKLIQYSLSLRVHHQRSTKVD